VDDVKFLHNGPMARNVALEYDKHNSRDSNQILLDDKNEQVLIVSSGALAGKVC